MKARNTMKRNEYKLLVDLDDDTHEFEFTAENDGIAHDVADDYIFDTFTKEQLDRLGPVELFRIDENGNEVEAEDI